MDSRCWKINDKSSIDHLGTEIQRNLRKVRGNRSASVGISAFTCYTVAPRAGAWIETSQIALVILGWDKRGSTGGNMSDKKHDRRFGISMTWYVKEHEQEVNAFLERYKKAQEHGTPFWPQEIQAVREKHLLMIGRLQHERLIHLIVTALVALLFALFAVVIFLFPVQSLVVAVPLILGVLLAAYLHHYFILENAVQRWYLLDDALDRMTYCRK